MADLFIGGGQEEELHVVVDPEKLAAYSLTISDVIDILKTENSNVSAGNLGVGRRDFRIRTTAEFKSPEDVENVVIKSTGQRRVLVKDIAEVRNGFAKKTATVLHNGEGGLAVGIKPEPGTNVLEMTDRVKEVVEWLNEAKMRPEKIEFEWIYDQRHYIRGAIDLIQQNILIGGALAILVLLIFLRSIRSTVVIATAIPISIIGTFLFMKAFNRSLNVVSLSGIAFAVGMLVDNAIVVIENIDRHRSMGKSAFDAAFHGTKEVWGAVLASTLTTVAVFLPVVFLEEEAGQLFRDIALAVVSAVMISLIVSVSVIPMFSRKLFSGVKNKKKGKSLFARLGEFLVNSITGMVSLSIRNWFTRLFTAGVLTAVAVSAAYFLIPKMEYLPLGNRNFVLTIFVPPPGLSLEEREQIGENLNNRMAPYLGKDHNGLPGITHLFYVGADRIMILGAISKHWDRAGELVPVFQRLIYSIPGMYGVSMQPGIFQTRLGRGRTIDLDISGDNLPMIVQAAGMMFGKIKGVIPDAQIRPLPSMELTYPEIRILPVRDRLKAVGMTAFDLGEAADVLMDGRIISDYKQEGKKKVDLLLMSSEADFKTPEQLYNALLVTPGGRIVPLSSLSRLERTTGITQIRHLERNRTITLQITPPFIIPLQSAMETIQNEIIDPFEKAGMLKNVNVRMSGAADKLTETRTALQWNFILAAVISYLLMSALFGNFIYPLIILFTVPLAGAGGFMGLKILSMFVPQTLDILTMLGFVILIGVVVNNAILIVHQSLNNVRYNGMDHKEAVIESVRVRLRPIYMSASTSIFGMLPLVLFPGSGSELYRGLGSVILGGIAVSTIFTVFVIPSLLMFVIKMEKPENQES